MSHSAEKALEQEMEQYTNLVALVDILVEQKLARMSRVRVWFTHPQATMPYRKHEGDAGWDLYTVDPFTIAPGQFMDIKTGVHILMPAGVWCRITGRSSTIRTWGIHVQEGIIDNTYTGEMFVGIRNVNVQELHVPAGTRLAQAIFHREVPVDLVFDTIEHVDWGQDGRGSAGFGSTGVGHVKE